MKKHPAALRDIFCQDIEMCCRVRLFCLPLIVDPDVPALLAAFADDFPCNIAGAKKKAPILSTLLPYILLYY
ncbi:hypothetical protein [Paenibacillus medicaginis]|uniref:hypothetical protein n=1 Tax=Paenibacillus medicaginis TaxID=1470560 RepID=UPI0035CCF1B1